MNYPFWDIGIGYGPFMAFLAVFHVFVSHFAIGGGLYLVLAEISARKTNDAARLTYLEGLSKFFVLTTLVAGAVTGVGIWFIIGLLNPAATEVLIHNFVWGWATEWTFFVMEITAAIIYYYGWKRMSTRAHLTVGWIYFIAAWLSLFIINGIVTFMLTPGEWLASGSFWDGFFNPTMWSSLVFRTGVCVMLAGLLSLLVASRLQQGTTRTSVIRYNAVWGLVGLVIMAPSFFWYFNSIPADIRTAAAEMMPTVMARLDGVYWFAIPLAVLLLFGFLLPKAYHFVIGVAVIVLGLVWFGQYEWMREAIRKPYVIYGYMYGNALEVAQVGAYESDGLLPHLAFKTNDPGADLFRHACRSCHTLDGYKALKPRFDGTDEEFIKQMVKGVGAMRGNMPPFLGTPDEAGLIAAHLYKEIDHRPMSQIYGLSGVALGEKVYETRCASCHVLGGYNDKTASLVGLTEDDYNDLLDMAGELGEEMPAFTASAEDRAALIQFLMTLKEGGSNESAGL